MQIGLGLDLRLGLSADEERLAVREAARLGYESVWTNAGGGREPFARCVRWYEAAREVGARMGVGTNVVPLPQWPDVEPLAAAAADAARRTEGAFVLGIGSGRDPRLAPVHDALRALRANLDVPVWLAALGPRMLRLGGEAAAGVALNWCTAEHVRWSRARVAEGARRAGRDRAAITVAQYIRVAVDDDSAAARRVLARAMLGYAIGAPAYRAHFARMGFAGTLRDLEHRRDADASIDDLAEGCPEDLLRAVGYAGPASGAPGAFRHLATGLDLAIVRVVPARPGVEAVLATLAACSPERVGRTSSARAR